MRHLSYLAGIFMLAACATASEPPPSSVAPANDPLEERLAWLAETFSDGDLTEAEYSANFTADFIDNVPYAEFEAAVSQVGTRAGGWSVGEVESRDGLTATVLMESTQAESLRANISLENVIPYRISGLLLQPADPPRLDNPPTDVATAAERLATFGDLSLGVFEIVDGSCIPVSEFGDSAPVPIGSAFKLFVLEAVARAVESGDLAWDDDIAIEDEHRSIPTGVMQDAPVGEEYSLREMAEAMIVFSDNTAADHLIALVGREAVEQVFADFQESSANVPLLDTMDLTALKLGPASGLADQWLEADESGRRDLIEQISAISPQDIPLSEFDEPILVNEIEWFATPLELCQLLDHIYRRGEPLTQILTINPGLPGDFEHIAFKGGSEPGLVAMNWLVENDGARFVVAGSVVNESNAFDQMEPTLLFGAVRNLAGGLLGP